MVCGCGREQVSKLMDQLIEFTRTHFCSEEQLMERTSFPGLAANRAEHHRMQAQILQSTHRFQHGEAVPRRSPKSGHRLSLQNRP